MTKKKLLAKAKEMGLDVTDALTKAQIQAAIDDAESVEVEVEETTEYEIEVEADAVTEDDVVIEVTSSEAEEILEAAPAVDEENEKRLNAVADAQADLVLLVGASIEELKAYAEKNSINVHKGLSRHELYKQIKKGVISRLKRPKR